MKLFSDLKKTWIDFSKDVRIPARDKKILVIFIIYLISPLDLITDWTPKYGLIDDFFMLAFIMDYLFNVLDSQLMLSHYPWGMKSYARFRSVARTLEFFVPNFIKKNLWLYERDPY